MAPIKSIVSMLVVFMAVISVVFAMPSPADAETMKPAETSHHLSFRYGGYPGYGYGFGGYRGGIGLSFGSPYYRIQGDYINDYPSYYYNY